MSESGSTDGDNNNAGPPFFEHYLGGNRLAPFEYDDDNDLDEDDSSSDFDVLDQFVNFRSSTSHGATVLHNTSDESDFESDTSSDSSGSSVLDTVLREPESSQQMNAAKTNSWCIPKELYKREIGHYDKRAKWSSNFYQSEVAVQKLKLSKQLKGHEGCVNSLDFNETGNILASGSDDCKICLWDWSRGTCTLKYKSTHTKNIFQTKFLKTQGDIRIVSTGRDGLVVLSAMNTSDVIYSKIIARHDRQCNKLAVHDEEPYMVLSCGEDGIVKNIDIRESPIDVNESTTNLLHVQNSRGNNMKLYSIDINPMNPTEFIINGDDEMVRMFDKRRISNEPLKKFNRNSSPDIQHDDESYDGILFDERLLVCGLTITSAVYNYCGTEILASYSNDSIYLFDVNGPPKSSIHKYSGHINKSTIKGVNFYGPRSEYVVSGSDCGYIFIWDKKTEAIVKRKHADSRGAVNVLEGHPHIPTLATSGLDKTIKIWEPLKIGKKQSKKKLQMCIMKNRRDYNNGIQVDLNNIYYTGSNNHYVSRYF